MKLLFDYINKYASNRMSEDDFEILKSYFVYKKLRKKQYFFQEGDLCKYYGFIIKGAMRQYTIDSKATEHHVQLAIENWWVGDRESWINATPSIYNIDAWENTELLLITRENTLKLVAVFPAFNEMVRAMDDKNNAANQKRISSSISFNAEERYLNFINSYPELFERFPQHIIASYLGITKDTLSRIRKQLSKK